MADGRLEIGESITITRTIQGFIIEGTGPDFARNEGNTRLVVNNRKAARFISACVSRYTHTAKMIMK